MSLSGLLQGQDRTVPIAYLCVQRELPSGESPVQKGPGLDWSSTDAQVVDFDLVCSVCHENWLEEALELNIGAPQRIPESQTGVAKSL
jgi:hypothetical protein